MGGRNSPLRLREADRVEIISIMDNSIDLLLSSQREEVKPLRDWVKKENRHPIAEHGFSMLIRVYDGDESHNILFDTGISPRGVVMNARRMGVNLSDIECIVLSHGHYDHFTGLPAVVKAIKKSELPIMIHKDMFKKRGVERANGTIREYPMFPLEDAVRPAKYIDTKEPHLIAKGLVLITGEIPRVTPFELGYPQHKAFVNGKWEPDPWLWDERALVINVRRKGLIILSGCSHAGIINTVLHSQRLTSIENIYAILGGLHLSGKNLEERITQTVEELKKIRPRIIVPSHCTGWRACYAIYEAMPDAFVWSSVGNFYIL
ncbi:MBL fold metallo-hydrolase [Candidatus Bathyarchaeota archaeon]|nr:MBL fold metallo-hydrolase [Candidatus Bathyarchaeota archaeon]